MTAVGDDVGRSMVLLISIQAVAGDAVLARAGDGTESNYFSLEKYFFSSILCLLTLFGIITLVFSHLRLGIRESGQLYFICTLAATWHTRGLK